MTAQQAVLSYGRQHGTDKPKTDTMVDLQALIAREDEDAYMHEDAWLDEAYEGRFEIEYTEF